MTLAAGGTVRVKVAVTERFAVMVTAQLPVPLQSPLQPPKDQPAWGAAASVTCVPVGWALEQEPVPQADGPAPVTLPPPATVTERT
jgi:hypothetical protein